MCMGPAELLGLLLYLICMETWNESYKQEVDGMFSSIIVLIGACRTFKLFQMLPFSICGTSPFST